MQIKDFARIIALISPSGLQRLNSLIYQEMFTGGYSFNQLTEPFIDTYSNLYRPNPLDSDYFYDRGYHPETGSFDSYKKLYKVLNRSQKIHGQDVAYTLFKDRAVEDIWDPIFLAAMKVVCRALNDAKVLFVLNGLSIGIHNSLKTNAAGVGPDAFGVYSKAGNREFISLLKEFSKELTAQTQKIVEAKEKGISGIALDQLIAEEQKAQEMSVITDFELTTQGSIKSKQNEWLTDPALSILVKNQIMARVITLLHEIGHRVEMQSLGDQSERLFYQWNKFKKTAPISKYGIHEPREWFAECWVAWLVDRLMYHKEIAADFEKLLSNIPLFQFSPATYNISKEALEKEFTLDLVGRSFEVQITFTKGPNILISGVFIGVLPTEIPTIQYRDAKGKTRNLNFFPNRPVKSIILNTAKGLSTSNFDIIEE